ncbi:MAC/Perforin domain-containing protein [Pedobacter steynii]|uniref:MAC/Perforin domain-containing protein n=1 Tax=Pedobacter steynii TaxID=430522 RepID=A0A1G9U438_9SPHI|nr:MAC/perforin domain-containing protein [Pedobacter steynii]NQX40650.1 hypothetical protein [Pedobacter steynii]SDM54749.1 MAC/Perforin domain-containing protein [Pedobacter steynii]
MKRFPLLFSVLLILWSCKKANVPADQPDLKSDVSKQANVQLRSNPTWNLLGYGYNVTGEYAKSTSARGQIINIQALKNAHPSAVEEEIFLNEDFSAELGGNSIEVSKGLTFKAGLDSVNIKAFKGSFTAAYQDSTYKSSKYIFAKYNLKKIQKRLYLIAPLTLLQSYLDPGFVSAIQSQTPAYIVQNYGTHFMKDILLGGRLEAFYEAQTSNSNRRNAAGGGLEISVLKIFGFSAGYSTITSEAASNFSQKLHYNVVGGTVSVETKTVSIDPNSTVIPVDISNWKNSVTPSSSTLIEFNNPYPGAEPLIPIYELIANPAKKAAVKSYIEQYLINNRVKIDPESVYENYCASISDHIYTLNPNENLQYNGWVHHGAAFKAFASQVPGTVPVFESYNDSWYMHHYAQNQYETSGWPGFVNNGMGWVKFYAYKTQVAGTVPVYQYRANRDYVYSTNGNLSGMILEGVAFYAIPN